MSDKKDTCDLCGLTVEIDGFRLNSKEGEKKFCCEGCKGIYSLLYQDKVLSQSKDNTK